MTRDDSRSLFGHDREYSSSLVPGPLLDEWRARDGSYQWRPVPQNYNKALNMLVVELDRGKVLNEAEDVVVTAGIATRYSIILASSWLEQKRQYWRSAEHAEHTRRRHAAFRRMQSGRPLPSTTRRRVSEVVCQDDGLESAIREFAADLRRRFPRLELTEANAIRSLLWKGLKAPKSKLPRKRSV